MGLGVSPLLLFPEQAVWTPYRSGQLGWWNLKTTIWWLRTTGDSDGDMIIGLAKDEEEMELFLGELMALLRAWEYLRLGTLGIVRLGGRLVETSKDLRFFYPWPFPAHLHQ